MVQEVLEKNQPYNIALANIEDEMRRSYLDYAMSVIVSRALPDVCDGLKPVHRRIIYTMYENGYVQKQPYRKSARIVGDVMGKYHPHGDKAIYDSMVRLAQYFSMRLPLIDGQGNFGSMDGDPPAAMRYTEARMAASAHLLIEDIGKNTVDFHPNYDETMSEPAVLPARFPNLLANGASGIAVGMATNIPPHNIGELIDACCVLIANPDVSIDELVQGSIAGPDFPTGGQILGRSGILSAFRTGRGSIIMRGCTHIEHISQAREAIIITEIPYLVNKANMIEQIAACVREKRVEGITDIRDESDRSGVRVVIEVRKGFETGVVLNQLYRNTNLQTFFSVNMLALNNGRPELMNLKDILSAFLRFRELVIRRRTVFLLNKARARAHILVGLSVAVANIDEVISLIRKANNPQIAREQLMAHCWPASDIEGFINLLAESGHQYENGEYLLSEKQARAILELRLNRLTGLERQKIGDDLYALGEEIKEYLNILQSREYLLEILKEELLEVREQFSTPRRTEIVESDSDFEDEDLIQKEDMVVTVSSNGYIKRVPLNIYRAQRRGGKGRTGMATREEDFVSDVFIANTHTPVLFFSSLGMVYKMKVWKIPPGTPQSKGRALVNMLPLSKNETISTVMLLPENEDSWKDMYAVFATASGHVRRNRLSDFTGVRVNGKIAMKLPEGDHLVRVRAFTEDEDIFLNTRMGYCIRFPVTKTRIFASRNSLGVRGIRLTEGDYVIGMSGLKHMGSVSSEKKDAWLRYASRKRRESFEKEEVEDIGLAQEELCWFSENEEFILTITANGFGKRTSSWDYRVTGRGGRGLACLDRTEKTGEVVAAFSVVDGNHIVMISNGGQIIRCPVNDIRIAARRTQGVTLFRVAEKEEVVSVTRLREENSDDNDFEEISSESDMCE